MKNEVRWNKLLKCGQPNMAFKRITRRLTAFSKIISLPRNSLTGREEFHFLSFIGGNMLSRSYLVAYSWPILVIFGRGAVQ